MTRSAPHPESATRDDDTTAAPAQRTLAAPATVEGHGLFCPDAVRLTFLPADADAGITFRRTDLQGTEPIPAHVDFAESRPRRTALAKGEATVDLVEHCLAALAGMGIDTCVVELDAPEPPAGDGSAAHFADAIATAGTRELDAPRRTLTVPHALSVQEGDASIAAMPPQHHEFDAVYRLDFGAGSPIPAGVCAERLDPATFARDIAPARTFTTAAEANAARDAGMFTHVSEDEFLVFGDAGPVGGNALRFDDEPARHKLLDLVGDLALVGRPLAGRFVAQRSGHELNRQLARAILDAARDANTTPEIPVRRIFDVLPHRYPMLLVDRVIETQGGERGVGVKNVSLNEPFFQGHYPGNPIMPGVLIIESMAQFAGLMLSVRLDHEGKIALLLSLDAVKLRKAVIPGDQLRLHAETVRYRPRFADVRCHATVDGETAAEARIKFMLVDKAFDPR